MNGILVVQLRLLRLCSIYRIIVLFLFLLEDLLEGASIMLKDKVSPCTSWPVRECASASCEPVTQNDWGKFLGLSRWFCRIWVVSNTE